MSKSGMNHTLHKNSGRIRDEIPKYDEHVQPLLKAVFSSIIIKAVIESQTLPIKEKYIIRPPGTTAILFHKKHENSVECWKQCQKETLIYFDWEMRG